MDDLKRRQPPVQEATQEMNEFREKFPSPGFNPWTSDFGVVNVHFIKRQGEWRIAQLAMKV